jgi:hypothetical protein
MEAEKLGNPAPIGLAGFGMTTILLNIHNTGLFPLGSMVLAMGLCYGGVAQIIAGILEFKRGNTFGLTAFVSYGFFWLSLVFIIVFKDIPAVPAGFMGWYLFLWGVFTFFMWFGAWGKNRVIQYVFLSLTVLYGLLAAAEWTGSSALGIIAGWEGITCGAAALYLAMAEMLNETHGRNVLPIG